MTKIRGSELEIKIWRTLGKQGFWCHIFAKAKDGSQPADIIAINHKGSHLIDAKECKSGRFEFDRREDNQINSMDWLSMRCGGKGWFAVQLGTKIYMLPKSYIDNLYDQGIRSLSKVSDGFLLEVWLNAYQD